MDNPLTFFARRELWQFFATLTFANPLPGVIARRRMLLAWLRVLARKLNCDILDLLWLAREEPGEIGGRPHFHVLLAGLPLRVVLPMTNFFLAHAWRKLGGGHPRCYIYDQRLSGVAYVMKGLEDGGFARRSSGAVAYEIGKYSRAESFESPDMLIPARALLLKWKRHVEPNRRHRKAHEMKAHQCDHATRRGVRPMGRPTSLAHPADLAGRLYI